MSKVYQYINYGLQGPNVVMLKRVRQKEEGAERRREKERLILKLFREG